MSTGPGKKDTPTRSDALQLPTFVDPRHLNKHGKLYSATDTHRIIRHMSDYHKSRLSKEEVAHLLYWAHFFKKNRQYYTVLKLRLVSATPSSTSHFSYFAVYSPNKKILGRGGQGTIKLVQNIEPGIWEAMKVSEEGGAKPEIEKELSVLHKLSKSSYDLLLDVTNAEKEKIITVMELIPGKSIDAFIPDNISKQVKKCLPLSERIYLAMCSCIELCEFHKHQLVHRDIKPQNFMYDPLTKKVTLIDFGSTIGSGCRADTKSTTPPYLAPEIVLQEIEASRRLEEEINLEFDPQIAALIKKQAKRRIEEEQKPDFDPKAFALIDAQDRQEILNLRRAKKEAITNLNPTFTEASDVYALGLLIGRLLNVVEFVNGAELIGFTSARVQMSEIIQTRDDITIPYRSDILEKYGENRLQNYFNIRGSAQVADENGVQKGEFMDMLTIKAYESLPSDHEIKQALNETQGSELIELLKNMTHADPAQRLSLDAAIAKWETYSTLLPMQDSQSQPLPPERRYRQVTTIVSETEDENDDPASAAQPDNHSYLRLAIKYVNKTIRSFNIFRKQQDIEDRPVETPPANTSSMRVMLNILHARPFSMSRQNAPHPDNDNPDRIATQPSSFSSVVSIIEEAQHTLNSVVTLVEETLCDNEEVQFVMKKM